MAAALLFISSILIVLFCAVEAYNAKKELSELEIKQRRLNEYCRLLEAKLKLLILLQKLEMRSIGKIKL